jgi:NRPS condensation-like uncharacterized protein
VPRPLKDKLGRDARVTIRLPSMYKHRLEALSESRGVTVNDIILAAIRHEVTTLTSAAARGGCQPVPVVALKGLRLCKS